MNTKTARPNASSTANRESWWLRHQFLIRRLHSLSGLIPVGAYMVVHLSVNASILNSPASFQSNVYQIHSLGRLLPLVEWTFIFLPLIFHAVLGVAIIRGGLPNVGSYQYASNVRYTLQRVSGMIAFLFIFWHVFHMHGWFHNELWLKTVAEPLGGAQFRPYNAASSVMLAMAGIVKPVLYAIGILACVFHLANGIWTMGITWGVWVSPAAQRRANWVCLIFGIGLSVVGLSALKGTRPSSSDRNQAINAALDAESSMLQARETTGVMSKADVTHAYEKHKAYTPDKIESLRQEYPAPANDADDSSEAATH